MDRFRHHKRFLLLSSAGLLLTGCGSTEPASADADTALIDELLNSDGDSAKLKEPAEPVYTEDNRRDSTQTVSRTRSADRRSGDPPGPPGYSCPCAVRRTRWRPG